MSYRLAIKGDPKGPAVIIAFESKHGPLKYATDVFDHWHANLRAIALGLEALRKVERYGITQRGEQYTGFRTWNSGIEMPAAQMTELEALEFLRIHAGCGHTDPTTTTPRTSTGLTATRRRSCIPTPELDR